MADEKAGIAPLLDVEDMVVMRKPDWKCVFTYVQSIYRRFKNEDWNPGEGKRNAVRNSHNHQLQREKAIFYLYLLES